MKRRRQAEPRLVKNAGRAGLERSRGLLLNTHGRPSACLISPRHRHLWGEEIFSTSPTVGSRLLSRCRHSIAMALPEAI